GALLGIAVGAARPNPRDLPAQLGVARALAQRHAQIGPPGREQTGHQLALDREARARTASAERLRDRRDHADLARPVWIAPALGDLAGVVRIDRLEGVFARDAVDDFARGHDLREVPVVQRADVHELDEAHDVAGAAKMAREIDDLVVVHAPLHHAVDLDR